MSDKNILIACEESQAICKAFRERGTERFLVIYKSARVDIQSGI